MNVMAQTMRSPMPSYEQQRRQSVQSVHSQRQSYPASPHPETLSPSNQGLGLFQCTMAPSQSTLSEITASPTATATWSHPAMMEQQSYSQSQPPDIFSMAVNPFSDFPSSSSTGMMGAHSPEAPGLDFCHTPPSSNMQSHRGSVSSSYAASEAYSQSGSDSAYTPRVKLEEAGEWYHAGSEHILQRGLSSQGPLTYSANANPLTSQAEDLYRPQPAEWSKNDTTGYITELHASPDGRLPRFDVRLPSDTRIKKKRQRTTPEEATHECRVCGKLFKRSYNWKSHLETHNPERKYPHPCTAMAGNNPCTKKFQRKTDLDRHYDSVCVSFSIPSSLNIRLTVFLGPPQSPQPQVLSMW